MRISLRWLAELVSPLPPVDELADTLTHAGLEVEAIEHLGQGLDRIVVGEVLTKEPMEGSDKLHLCTVDAGDGAPHSIVCGASNYEVGSKVPAALVGAVLPGGLRIEARKLRGVPSNGMLCSEVELGISDEGEGLMILEADAEVGTPIATYLHLSDVVLTVNATPNRPDWLSHVGVAREVAAATGATLRFPEAEVVEAGGDVVSKASIQIEWEERCGRYAARVVEGLRFGSSPRWMQARLNACGMRPLGNLIDVTNYVLLEAGHPLHAFDLDKVEGQTIRIRAASKGEKLTTLDGKERTLDADDLVIADTRRPLVLAGVMGGADAEVGEGTTRVLLESAHFEPAGIRRSSKRHGLHTESSHRFERGTDPEAVRWALDRAAHLLSVLAGGVVAEGVLDDHPGKREPGVVRLRTAQVGRLLGVEIPKAEMGRILSSLGFSEVGGGDGESLYRVPTFRTDVEREVDLIEEIARVHGYDKIPEALPSGAASPAGDDPSTRVLGRIAAALSAAGLDEAVHLAFGERKEDAAILRTSPSFLSLRNPLAAHQDVMRVSLLPGLLRTVAFNRNRGSDEVRLWEHGKVFLPLPGKNQPVQEPRRLGGVMVGRRPQISWASPEAALDFFDLKGVVEGVLAAAGIRDPGWEPSDAPFLHPRSACRVSVGEVEIGVLGELHPEVAETLDLPRGIFVFELSLDVLDEAAVLEPHYRGVPRFPAVLRDLAVVVPQEVTAAAVQGILRGPLGKGLVEDVEIFDLYEGPQVGEGRKSMAFAIRYRDPERTLSDKEVSPVHDALVASLTKELGAELRG